MKTRASEAEKLRQLMGRRGDARGRMPRALRERGVAYARASMQSGATIAQIAREIGVSETTVTRWTREDADKLVAVRVVGEVSTLRGALVVTTRNGLRVEGLDLDALCTLIERCG